MRSLALLLFLVGNAIASGYDENDNYGWEIGKEYEYLVRTHAMATMETLSFQHTGVILKATLKLQHTSHDTFKCKLLNPQYAQLHTELLDGWDSYISDDVVEFKDLPLSSESFIVRLKHKLVREVIIADNLPTWEINMIKSIVSQFQVDTQGENLKRSKGVQIPDEEKPYATFHSMEDSITGKCEVLYDIVPLVQNLALDRPDLLLPNTKLAIMDKLIYVMKTKNYDKCDQRVDYHFGISGNANWESDIRNNDQIMRRSSTTHMLLSGNLKNFVIQAAVTKTQIVMKPRLADEQEAAVMSKINVTLVDIQTITKHLSEPSRPVSCGNLVYTYDDSFSENRHQQLGRPNESLNSMSSEMNSDSESNEELRLMRGMFGHILKTNIVSDENKANWRKPTLTDAPRNPYLSLYVDNQGKSVLESDKMDSTRLVQKLVEEIVHEIENPNIMPQEDTLEKYTLLSRFMSTMNLEKLNKAKANLFSVANKLGSDEQSQTKRENIRAVFRDTLAGAGTGPALMIIKNWIEQKHDELEPLEGLEAAEVLSVLPKTARTPTAEYVEVLFSMAKNPEIQKQRFLNSSVVLSLAELMHLTQVFNTSMYNYYPVNVIGRLSPKYNDAVERKYIPYFEEQLKKAIMDGDSPKIQVYITALGLTGHPKILSVFEPYLEGKKQVSTYQRFMMVMSLKKLTTTKPSLARSVLYKIYLNTWDASHIRCAAVYLLMLTNPPLDMLTRMAQFTNSDPSKQVSSAVKSSIENVAQLTFPEWQGLANNARKVIHLLDPTNNGYYSSQNFFKEIEINDQFSYRVLFNYIRNDDSIIPMSLFSSWKPSYNGFLDTATELGLSVSSVRSLLQMFWHGSEKLNVGDSYAEKIAKLLNIESDPIEQVEGTLLFRSRYRSEYLFFDNHTIERTMDYLYSSKHRGRFNVNKWLSNDMVLSFPTDTGLPFVYTLHRPILYKFSGATTPDIKSGFDVRVLASRKTAGRVGFLTPFNHQAFVAGIDQNMQVYLPVRLNYKLDNEKHRFDVKLRPSEHIDTNIRALHISVIPYTSQYDYLSLRPLLLSKNTLRIETDTPIQIKFPGKPDSVFSLECESDSLIKNLAKHQWLTNEDRWDDMKALSMDEGKYEKLDLYVKPNLQENEAIKLSVVWDTKEIRSNNDNSDKESWESGNKVFITDQRSLDSPDRRDDMLQKVSKALNSGNAYVVDLGLQIPGAYGFNHALTWSLAIDSTENKWRSLLYTGVYIPNTDESFEICSNAQMKTSVLPAFDYKKILSSNPMSKMNINIRSGKSCSEGKQLSLKAYMKQTEDYKEYVKQSSLAKKCEKNHSNRIRDCQKAAKLAKNVNELDMTISFDSNYDTEAALDVAFKLLKQILGSPEVNFGGSKEISDNNGPKIRITLSPDMTTADITLSSKSSSFTFPNVPITSLELDNEDMIEDELTVSCNLEKNEAITFDGKTYPLKLGKCSHVLLTTYPEHNPNKFNELWNIPENMELTITAQETEGNRKEVKVGMGEDEVTLQPSDMELEVLVNGRKVKCTEERNYQQVKNDETVFEVHRLPGPGLRLLSDKYDLDLVYDGKNVQIELPPTYRKSIRGLCGDYDGRSENDFVTPMNCLLRKPEEFASTYILKDKCEGNALKLAKKVHLSKCVTKSLHLSDVISDDEAGRTLTNWKQWGYHRKDKMDNCYSHQTRIISKPNKICFTMRPVPMCIQGCKPQETKQKKYNLYCLPKNEQSMGLKNRIEQGANPDLSQRTLSHSEILTVPVVCVPA